MLTKLMKIKQEHFEYIRDAINKTGCNTPEWKAKYLSQGLTEKRFRWDLMYAANLTEWICKNLYSYLNDTHIDTALKNIAC